ncbi:MAG: NADH-dependent oxidoreductase, partial [Phycisphaerales bacterium]|nr:NADH-dependent oxidoreductase [Phycisphaerales bacterium]
MMKLRLLSLLLLAFPLNGLAAPAILVEAEGFESYGGWSLDTQFMDEMGSPYLLAHGTGTPVGNAVTVVECPEAGQFRGWVRTFDWVARW